MGNKQSSSCMNDSARLEKYGFERKTTLRQNFLCNLLRKSRWITAFFTRTNLTNREKEKKRKEREGREKKNEDAFYKKREHFYIILICNKNTSAMF
uniref:Uncharacterized protein n=1 Tax=Onchocerca volvulus TaxID=6282 RepID=A0A8R1TN43_ONCVO